MFKLSPKTIVILSAICFLGLVVLQLMWIRTAYKGEKALLLKEKKQFEIAIQNAFNRKLQFKDSLKKILDTYNESHQLSRENQDWIATSFKQVIDSVELTNNITPENFGIVRLDKKTSLVVPIALTKQTQVKRHEYEHAGKLCLHCMLDLEGEGHVKYNYQVVAIYSPEKKIINRRLGLMTALSLPLLLLLAILFGQIVKKYQQEKRLSQAKNDFINNLSHEIQTPVFAIQVANKIMRERSKDPETSHFSRIIEKETSQLKEHAAKILQLASLENEKTELILEKVELNSFIEEKRPTLELMAAEKKGVFEFNFSKEPLFAELDTIHFNNVIVSLADNAIKYNDSRPLVILRTFKDKNRICLSVSDNGIGIPKEFLPFVFDKFYRAPQKGRQVVNGFGLGLNYVREVMSLHNGYVTITSEEGKGTTVTISLPATGYNV